MHQRPPPALLTHHTYTVVSVGRISITLDTRPRVSAGATSVTVVGLATIEDALEQIVGEIREEHEPAVALQALDGPLELDGITNIRDLETQYKIELPYDAGFETLAGFLLSRLGHIPTSGEEVEFEGRKFTVLQMERNRIFRVRIDLPQAPEPQEPEKGAEDA